MKSVYCAVGIGTLNKAVCASYLKGKIFLYLTFTNLNFLLFAYIAKRKVHVTVFYPREIKLFLELMSSGL